MADDQNSLFDPVGEFLVPESTVDRAEDEFAEQSRRSQHVDRQNRAPVTTDFSKWEENTDRWDFPSVDTPTENPNTLPKDLMVDEKPRTTDADTPDGRTVVDPLSSEERGKEEFKAQATAEDVSLTRGEAFRGVGLGSPSAPGGQAYNALEGTSLETDRPDQEQKPPEQALERQQGESDLFKTAPGTLPGGYEQTEVERFGDRGGLVRYERDTELPGVQSEVIEIQDIQGTYSVTEGVRKGTFDIDSGPVTAVQVPDDREGVFEAARSRARPEKDTDEPGESDPFVGFDGMLTSEKERDSKFRGPNS